MLDEPTVRYRLNARNEIAFVDEGWDRFAAENDAPELMGDAVLGRPLSDFLRDESIAQVYRHLLDRVRRGHPARFEIRCDGPERRRLLSLHVRATTAGEVEFTTTPVRLEPRDPVRLLDRRAPRGSGLVRLCAWCNRVWADDGWLEVENAIARLGLFETQPMPALTHGMCPGCLDRVTAAFPGAG